MIPKWIYRMEQVILASSSLRRQEILNILGIPFHVLISDLKEFFIDKQPVSAQIERIAKGKITSVLDKIQNHSQKWVVGADTVIFHQNRILGKAKSYQDAYKMLKSYSGQEHSVITGLAIYNSTNDLWNYRENISHVRFCHLDDDQIEWYLASGEWQGVAGAYRIQGRGACFIEELKGSYSSVMGLPIHDFYAMLRESGYSFN